MRTFRHETSPHTDTQTQKEQWPQLCTQTFRPGTGPHTDAQTQKEQWPQLCMQKFRSSPHGHTDAERKVTTIMHANIQTWNQSTNAFVIVDEPLIKTNGRCVNDGSVVWVYVSVWLCVYVCVLQARTSPNDFYTQRDLAVDRIQQQQLQQNVTSNTITTHSEEPHSRPNTTIPSPTHTHRNQQHNHGLLTAPLPRIPSGTSLPTEHNTSSTTTTTTTTHTEWDLAADWAQHQQHHNHHHYHTNRVGPRCQLNTTQLSKKAFLRIFRFVLLIEQ